MVVQRRQGDVGEQRGENPALRGSGQCLFPISGGRHDPGLQERLYQRADALVLDPDPEAIHQSRMRDFVETGLDVGLQHPMVVPRVEQDVDLGDRVLRAPVRAEPVRARLEVRLEDGFEHCLQAGLDHPVSDGRDTELAELSAFSSVSSPAALRTGRNSPDFSESRIWPRNASTPIRVSIMATVALSIPGVRAPALRGHAFPRVHQERRVIDEVEQVTEPAGGIFSRPAVQLDLHPPYREVAPNQDPATAARRRYSPARLRTLHSSP